MTSYENCLKRVHMLRGHINYSPEAHDERKSPSFSVQKAREAFWGTFPPNYFETYEALAGIHGLYPPSMYMAELKEDMRYDTNKIFASLIDKMFEKGFTNEEKIADNIDSFLAGVISLNTTDYSLLTKNMVQYGLYCKTIKNLGTEKHRQLLLDGCALRTFGCFGLTEIGHGSNVRGVETTAEYDPETQEFVINSPTKTAAKFWIGNLGKTCQNAVIFAQLITQEENKGVHAFVFEVRDRNNHVPHPGIQIGDCGDKKGAHGIDNGWISFDHYRVPRDALLDKFGSVDKEGNYSSSIKSDGKRFANSIASLSGGRVLIGRLSCEAATIALTATLRYAAARKQFGPAGGPEVSLLTYPSYQNRIITRFVSSFINIIGCNRMVKLWLDNLPNLLKEKNRQTNLCHGLCSNIKCFVAWETQDTVTECRKACGGNGYLRASLFGEILNINDLNQTWEGDNHVLMMQTQQFLFKCLRWLSKGEEPMETVEFLTLAPPDLDELKPDIYSTKSLQEVFAARACAGVHKASAVMMQDLTKVDENFNKHQKFELREMCQGYHDIYMIDTFTDWVASISDSSTKAIYDKFLLVHMHKLILNDPVFFKPILGEDQMDKIKVSLIKELKELRKDIIPLTDVVPFPNSMLGVLGNEDMQVYDRILATVKATPKVTERPSWWKLAYANAGAQ